MGQADLFAKLESVGSEYIKVFSDSGIEVLVFLQLVLQARCLRHNLMNGSVSCSHMPEFLFIENRGFWTRIEW